MYERSFIFLNLLRQICLQTKGRIRTQVLNEFGAESGFLIRILPEIFNITIFLVLAELGTRYF